MKKILFLILFFQFSTQHGLFANTKIDSLRHETSIAQNDSVKAQLLNKLASELIGNSPANIDTVRFYLNQSIAISEKINFIK